MTEKIRNIAIIAHVDHGKTTLVDKLLQQTGTLNERGPKVERLMDSNALEKERGITITAKNTCVHWEGFQINIDGCQHRGQLTNDRLCHVTIGNENIF